MKGAQSADGRKHLSKVTSAYFAIGVERCLCRIWTVVLLFEADNLALAPLRSLPKGILYEKSFNLKTISEGDFGHFRENNLIILCKVAKIALKIVLN